MNDPQLVFDRIDKLLASALSWSEPDQLAAYGAVMHLIREVKEYIEESKFPGYLNASGKLDEIKWHVAAMFRMDIGNGHSAEDHCSWARADLNDLSNIFSRLAGSPV